MCKVMMISGIKKENLNNAWRFAKAMAKPMTQYQNKDGIGYAAITAEGRLFGERWLDNSYAFRQVIDGDMLYEEFEGAVEGKKEGVFEYNSFGQYDPDNVVAITMHTRMATSAKGMQNVHPFVDEGVSIIHNGIIRNVEDFDFKVSTCDSEAILRSYIHQDIGNHIDNVQKMATMLKGYYAVGAMTNTEEGPVLDIFKSAGARLHAAYVKELGTYVVSTDDDDIKNTCKELGFTMGNMSSILAGKFMRFDAITGKRKGFVEFTPSEEFRSYSHSGGYPASTQTTTTNTSSTGKASSPTTTTKAGMLIGRSNVHPMGKQKNTKISETLMNYFNSGKPVCIALNEREIQEEIHLGQMSRA